MRVGKVTLRPSKKLRALIVVHGSLGAAVAHWGVPYMTMKEWLSGKYQLPGDTVARIVEVTKLSYDDLFEHKGGSRKAKR